VLQHYDTLNIVANSAKKMMAVLIKYKLQDMDVMQDIVLKFTSICQRLDIKYLILCRWVRRARLGL